MAEVGEDKCLAELVPSSGARNAFAFPYDFLQGSGGIFLSTSMLSSKQQIVQICTRRLE